MDFIEKNELGMIPLQKKIFRTKIGKKSGMILTTGPTGSGKTSTLYAALKLVCRPEISVISVEDPVEYRIPGITQVEVNEKRALLLKRTPFSCAAGSRCGDDRGNTRSGNGGNGRTCRSYRASCPVYASYERCRIGACPPDRYGHSAVPAFRVAVPHHFSKACEKLCPACRKEMVITREMAEEKLFPEAFIGRRAYMAKGCDHCRGKGADGRTGVFEMLEIGKEERRLLHKNAAAEEFSECMKNRDNIP